MKEYNDAVQHRTRWRTDVLQGLGTGPVIFSHGWPLSADAWDVEMKLAADHGFRAVAHDRRGHGRSSQTWDGNDMDTYAADLAALIDGLDLHDSSSSATPPVAARWFATPPGTVATGSPRS